MTTPTGPGTDDARLRELALAENELDRELGARALERAEALLALDPDDVDALVVAARAHLVSVGPDDPHGPAATAHHAAAVAATARAVELAPAHAPHLRLHAGALAGARRFRDARSAAAEAVRLDPTDAWNHGIEALVLLDAGVRGPAAESAARAVALAPDDPDIRLVQARTALGRGGPRSRHHARVHALAALELAPTHGEAALFLAGLDGQRRGSAATARSLDAHADRLRADPGDQEAQLQLDLVARNLLLVPVAIMGLSLALILRTWWSASEDPAGFARPVALGSVAVAAAYLVVTIARLDPDVRRYLADLVREPLMAGAAVATGLAVVSLVVCAFWPGDVALWWTLPAAVACAVAAVCARQAARRPGARRGRRSTRRVRLDPLVGGGDALVIGCLGALSTVGFTLIAILQPDGPEQDDPLQMGLCALGSAAVTVGAYLVWRKRRRERQGD